MPRRGSKKKMIWQKADDRQKDTVGTPSESMAERVGSVQVEAPSGHIRSAVTTED